jgi:hypothetical protein
VIETVEARCRDRRGGMRRGIDVEPSAPDELQAESDLHVQRRDAGRQCPSGSAALVPVMETADLGQFHDRAHARRLDWPRRRRVLPQRQVRPRPVIVGEVGLQDPIEVMLTKNNDAIEAFSTYRTHKAFSIWIR